MVVARRWDSWRMRVAIDHAQGGIDWSGDVAAMERDLMFEAFELNEDARVDLWN